MRVTSFGFVCALLVIWVAVVNTGAYADSLTFTGYTQGCFGTPNSPTSSSDSFSCTYQTNPSVTNTSSNGQSGTLTYYGLGNPLTLTAATFGTAPLPGTITPTPFSLGYFTLIGSSSQSSGTLMWGNSTNNTPFDLKITFVAPPITSGGQSRLFDADITGKIKNASTTCSSTGSNVCLDVVWDTNTINNIPFNTGTYSGFFDLTVNNLQFTAGDNGSVNENLTGNIVVTSANPLSANPVPEPASIALFGSGLLGLAGFARRRFLK